MEKTKEQLIHDFKKANSQRKQKIAEKNGFKTPTEYLASLEKKTKIKVKKEKTNKMKGTFYVVDILDSTGSMSGGKYENSKEGIIAGIKDLMVRKDVKYTLVEFIESTRPLNYAIINIAPSDIKTSDIRFSGAIGGNTPLYWTVYEVISKMNVTKDDKVLINVFTDGGNNTMSEFTSKAAELIEKVQKENFTVTFVATAEDLAKIKRDINIRDSNTLATPNTAQGFARSMAFNTSSRTAYFTRATAGENVLVGFYKKEGTL